MADNSDGIARPVIIVMLLVHILFGRTFTLWQWLMAPTMEFVLIVILKLITPKKPVPTPPAQPVSFSPTDARGPNRAL